MWKAATALAKAWQLQDWFFFYKLVRCQACPDRSVPGSSTSLPSKLLIPSHLPTKKRIYSPQKAMRHLITYYQQVCCNVAARCVRVQGGCPWGKWVHGDGGDLRVCRPSLFGTFYSCIPSLSWWSYSPLVSFRGAILFTRSSLCCLSGVMVLSD